MTKQKILVIGAGGVGGYFGAVLAQAGNDVTFLARGKQLEALREHGLTVSSSINGSFTLDKVNAVSDISDLTGIQLVILGVKAWQVKDVARSLKSLPNQDFVVLPLQNGVDAYQDLISELPAQNILGGSCQIISYVEKPGHIVHIGIEPKIVLGEWNNEKSARIKDLAQLLENANIVVENPDSIQVALWEKFLFIASVGGVGAVTRVSYGHVRDNPRTRAMLEAAMHEVLMLAQKSGVNLSPTIVEKTMAWVAKVPAEGTPSMQRDVMDGKPSELENMSGSIVRRGEVLGVPTPVHLFLYSSLLPAETIARNH
ncbi:MAG: 2-dehydropantoate 2-reductase [Candidatus Obscuribacterales bacterium]|nr:2-dehydropantoate 2-reductase [Candidatus Obscuribacterales bacterium]